MFLLQDFICLLLECQFYQYHAAISKYADW